MQKCKFLFEPANELIVEVVQKKDSLTYSTNVFTRNQHFIGVFILFLTDAREDDFERKKIHSYSPIIRSL